MKTNMVRCITEVYFEQVATASEPSRNLKLNFDFAKEYSASDSWASLTNQAKIIFPKNIYVIDSNKQKFALGGTQPSKQLDTLFRRGDKIEIRYGYYMYGSKETKEVNSIFKGFVSKVTSKMPIQLDCEDNMWLLKQMQCKPQTWPKTKTVEALMKSLLEGTGFTVNALTETTVGDLVIQDETIAQLIGRLRKDFHLEAYFKGDELRIGSVVYIPSEALEHKFEFQKNIISDQLEYKRKDDVKLSAICESINTVDGTETNKKGHKKTTNNRLQVLVYCDTSGNFKHIEKQKDVDFPANTDGERRTLFFPNVDSVEKLAQLGEDELKKYYYDGFKGKFTTFAIPFAKLGDNARISDAFLPDRNGLYKIREVEYSGGINGHRQIITLDYKLT